jgi:hypothetical protein
MKRGRGRTTRRRGSTRSLALHNTWRALCARIDDDSAR